MQADNGVFIIFELCFQGVDPSLHKTYFANGPDAGYALIVRISYRDAIFQFGRGAARFNAA